MKKITNQSSLKIPWLNIKYLIVLSFGVFLSVFNGHAQTYSYTGAVQTVTLAAGDYEIEAWGADGGKGFQTSAINNEGKGGYSKGILTVTTPTTYYIYVGGKGTDAASGAAGDVYLGGWNGGGDSGQNNYSTTTQYRAGGGGGGSDVRTTQNTTYANRVIVAGGGGGGVYLASYAGGNGGGISGGDGGNTYHGDGGTQTAGGTANANGTSNVGGTNGALGIGGTGGTASTKSGGGGGGGGYYGGGGGATGNTSSSQGGGGGGSSYLGGVATGVTLMFGDTGFVPNPDTNGNGTVIITSMAPCTGTPTVGTASATSRNCSSEPFTLSVTSATKAGGITYQWERSDAGTGIWQPISGATSASYTVTNQTVASDYRFVITCSYSTNTVTSNVVTVAQTVASYIFEGFENTPTGTSSNNTYPSCWSYVDTVSSSGYGHVSTSAANNGSNGFYTYRTSTTGASYDGDVLLISPETNNLGNGTKQLRFSARVSSASYISTHQFEVYTTDGTTSTATKTLLQGSIPLTNNWQEFIIPIPATTDDYFAFSFERNGGISYVYLDDIYYEDLSPCAASGNIQSSAITQTAATISWDFSLSTAVTGYEYEVRTSGAAGSGATGLVVTNTTNATTNTVNLTNLMPGTSYTVYVRSICGSTSGSWTTFPHTFNTLCGIIDSLFEGFESTSIGSSTNNTYPLCWSYVDTVTSSGYGYVNNSAANNGNNGFYTYRSSLTSASYNGDVLLISPETNNLGNGSKQLRFFARVSSSSYISTHQFEVYTMDGTTTSATKTLLQGSVLLTDTWQEFTIPLPVTTDDYFAFSFERSGGASYVYLDDVYYEDIPPPALTTTQTDNICPGDTNGMASVVVTGGASPLSYLWNTGDTTPTINGLAAGAYTVTVTDALNRTATATVTITEPAALVSNAVVTNVTCNGANDGNITIAPTGGTFPYTYLWNDGSTSDTVSGLTPGTYSVTITDINGCFVSEDIVVTEPVVLTTSGTQVDVSVYKGSDGSATVTATGGTTPYAYLWSNGATNATATGLVAGTYTVTVTDANGCTSSLDFVITQPIPLMVQSVSQTNVSCNGGADGAIALVVIGANAPYTYQWSPTGGTGPTATGLSAGTYTVLITEATGDTLLETFTITEPDPLVSTMSQVTDITCNAASNGTATVSVTGGTAPYTYFWSNGMTAATATNLNVGNYSVTITDANGCKTTANASIAQPTALVASPSSTNITCFGLNDGTASVSVSGGVAPYTYLWSNGQTGNSLSSLSQGSYTVNITDANNCTTTQSFTITEPAFVYPPVAVNQSFCIGQNATLADMVITGSNIKWYSASSGGTLLPASTVLTNGTTYYASQTVGTCESATRTAVQVTLNQGTPLTTTQLNVCSNTRIQTMVIDGFNYTQLRWYSSATSTVQLPSTQLLATTTYYVSSLVGTCESPRQAIQVTVATVVPAPTAVAQTACGNTTLNDLTVVKDPSATLRWYTSLQAMIPLAGTTQVSTGTFYVQQVIGACESVRVAVPVQVITATAPTMTSIATCDGNTIADLHPNTGTYVWYVNNTTTTALPDSFVITTGTYYIAFENSGCISSRVNVAVNVNARPASPTGQSSQTFGFSAKVSDLQMNQPNVSWFSSYNDAVKQVNQLAPTHPLQDQTTYYGILTGSNNCGSLIPTAVTVRINLSNTELDLAQLKYYPNPVDSELNISYIEAIKKVEVFTITGQRVLGNDYQGNEVKVDLSSLSAGTYMVKIETAKASQFVKIVKR